jgi:hypothetical protein
MNLRAAAAEARKQRAAQQALAKCCVNFHHQSGAGTFALKLDGVKGSSCFSASTEHHLYPAPAPGRRALACARTRAAGASSASRTAVVRESVRNNLVAPVALYPDALLKSRVLGALSISRRDSEGWTARRPNSDPGSQR